MQEDDEFNRAPFNRAPSFPTPPQPSAPLQPTTYPQQETTQNIKSNKNTEISPSPRNLNPPDNVPPTTKTQQPIVHNSHAQTSRNIVQVPTPQVTSSTQTPTTQATQTYTLPPFLSFASQSTQTLSHQITQTEFAVPPSAVPPTLNASSTQTTPPTSVRAQPTPPTSAHVQHPPSAPPAASQMKPAAPIQPPSARSQVPPLNIPPAQPDISTQAQPLPQKEIPAHTETTIPVKPPTYTPANPPQPSYPYTRKTYFSEPTPNDPNHTSIYDTPHSIPIPLRATQPPRHTSVHHIPTSPSVSSSSPLSSSSSSPPSTPSTPPTPQSHTLPTRTRAHSLSEMYNRHSTSATFPPQQHHQPHVHIPLGPQTSTRTKISPPSPTPSHSSAVGMEWITLEGETEMSDTSSVKSGMSNPVRDSLFGKSTSFGISYNNSHFRTHSTTKSTEGISVLLFYSPY